MTESKEFKIDENRVLVSVWENGRHIDPERYYRFLVRESLAQTMITSDNKGYNREEVEELETLEKELSFLGSNDAVLCEEFDKVMSNVDIYLK